MLTHRQKRRFLKTVVTLGILMIGLVISAARTQTANTRLYYFDVGQGNASLIRMPDGTDVLIDGGPDSKVLSELGKAMPFYDRSIEYVVLTHPHLDHFGGLIDVVNRYHIGKIILTGVTVDHNQLYDNFLSLLSEKKVLVENLEGRERIEFDNDTYLQIIYPNHSIAGTVLRSSNNAEVNDSSVVLKLTDGANKFLFPGDVEVDVEAEMVRQKIDLSADVLMSPHHGSHSSSTELFLQAVNPRLIIISLGSKNKYGHPHKDILSRYQSMNFPYLRTDFAGTVVLESDGKSYWRVR